MLSEPTLDDVLADRQKHMLCSDVDPALRRRKELTKKDQARGARSLAGPAPVLLLGRGSVHQVKQHEGVVAVAPIRQ